MNKVRITVNKKYILLVSGMCLLWFIAYNYFYEGQEWMRDLWFVLFYFTITYLFSMFWKVHSLVRLNVFIWVLRFFYNLGILLNLWVYDNKYANYGVLAISLLVFIVNESKNIRVWLKSQV